MLNILIEKSKNNSFRLIMQGHCEAGNKGEDLVCAAASALCMTMKSVLCNNKNSLKQKPYIDIKDGNATMIWKPKDNALVSMTVALQTVMEGFKWMSKQYPESISINF